MQNMFTATLNEELPVFIQRTNRSGVIICSSCFWEARWPRGCGVDSASEVLGAISGWVIVLCSRAKHVVRFATRGVEYK